MAYLSKALAAGIFISLSAGCSQIFRPTPQSNVVPSSLGLAVQSSTRTIAPFNQKIGTHMYGNGHAETWDGRVFILTWGGGGGCNAPRWMVRVMRPENIQRNAQGHPVFDGTTASDPVQLDCSSGEFDTNALAVIPALGTSTGENPFRSGPNGDPDPRGPFETYDLLLFSQQYQPINRMYQRRARIIVGQPKTQNAFVHKAEFLSERQFLKTTQGAFIPGIEPTLPVDGRLLLFHIGNVIHYSYNANPNNPERWSPPKTLVSLYDDRNVDLAGMTLGERYPLAAHPLKDGFGERIRFGYNGAYPWISLDGTELFHTTISATDGAMRSAVAVIGRWTNWTLKHIDGPINPNLIGSPANGTLRLFYSSPGQNPGMWPIYPKSGAPLPVTRQTPVVPLFGSNTGDYNEVSFDDFMDGNYRIFFRMNELLLSGFPNMQRTPDTSGAFNTGELEGGASFPIGVSQRPDGTATSNENVGVHGRAVYFPPTGVIRVRNTPASGPGVGLANLAGSLTFQFWVKRFGDLPGGQLVHREGFVTIGYDDLHRLRVKAWTPRGLITAVGGAAMNSNRWYHVACVLSASGLLMYVDGQVVKAESGSFQLSPLGTDLLIGPGSVPGQPPGPQPPVLVMDEFALSVVERSSEEIARAAFVDPVIVEQGGGVVQSLLPLGLDAKDLRLPSENITSRAVVELGRRIFSDPRFSANRQVSCATCHEPHRDFTDGLTLGKGVSGRPLERNTPTILNRAFSTRQMSDGRSASLESQVELPLNHADEMGFSMDRALAEVNSDPSYRSAFRAVFGVTAVGAQQFNQAVAHFQRAQMSGNSKVDQYEAGNVGSLSPQQIRGRALFHGKARCVACHSGSNYTDESFHNIGLGDSDPGRERVTGRWQDRGSFKTPTLRNLAKTGPYFHNGSSPSLQAVVAHYVTGGTARIVNGQDVRDTEMRKLDLTATEQDDLVAFLGALQGELREVYLGTDPGGNSGGTLPTTTTSVPPTTQPGSDYALVSGSFPNPVFRNEEFEVRCNYNRPTGCAYATVTNGAGCRFLRGDGNAQIFGCTATQVGSVQVNCGLSRGILPACPNVLSPIGSSNVVVRDPGVQLHAMGARRSGDNVGEYTTAPDGRGDGELQLNLVAGGPKRVTRVEIRSSQGGIWDTDEGTPYWIAKIVHQGQVLNGAGGAVDFEMRNGAPFTVYLPDSAGGDHIRGGFELTVTVQFQDGSRGVASTVIGSNPPLPTTTTVMSTTTTLPPSGPRFISGFGPAEISSSVGEYLLHCIYTEPLGCVYATSGRHGCRYVRTEGANHIFGCPTTEAGLRENMCGLSRHILPTCPNQTSPAGTTRVY